MFDLCPLAFAEEFDCPNHLKSVYLSIFCGLFDMIEEHDAFYFQESLRGYSVFSAQMISPSFYWVINFNL